MAYDFDKILDGMATPKPPKAAGYDFDATLDAVTAPPVEPLHSALYQASFANPDEEAKRQKLAREMGTPAAILPSLPDAEASAWLKRNPPESMLAEAPALAKWLESAENAKVARDDFDVLRKVGDLFRAPAKGVLAGVIGGSIGGAAETFDIAARAIGRPFRPIFGDDTDWIFTSEIASVLRPWGALAKRGGAAIDVPAERRGLDTDVAEGIGQLGGQIAAALLTGGAASGAMLYGQGVDQMATKTANDNANTANRDAAMLLGGAWTTLTERYGIDKILNRVPPEIRNRTLRFLADKLAAGGIEAAQEFAEGLLHDVTRVVLTNPEAPILDDIGHEMTVAGLSATLVRTALGVKGHRRASEQQRFFEALGDNAKASKLRERMPEKWRDLVEHYSKDGPVQNVFVDAQTFQTYFQGASVDPQILATALGIRDYQEALARGGDVAIPIGAFAEQIAPTDHLQALIPDLKVQPWEMTPREAQLAEANREAAQAKLQSQLEQMTAASQGDASLNAQIQKITDDVAGQLGARYDQKTAETLATVMRGIAVTAQREATARAQEQGLEATPEEITALIDAQVQKYGLKINAKPALPEVLTSQSDFEAQIDPLLDQMRGLGIDQITADETMSGIAQALSSMGIDLATTSNAAVKAALFPGATFEQPAYHGSPFKFDKFSLEHLGKGEGAQAFYQRDQSPRAQIRIGADRKISIDLLKNANLSSFLHETGHFYLELLGDLAEAEGASQQVRDDYAAILKWLGATDRAGITTEMHESFARANEAYLMEGKAPSPELRSAFARFKSWLKMIYRELTNLRVTLSDEVRGVFDRIYATDAEIAAAQSDNAFLELFTTPEQMGVSRAEFDRYAKMAAGEILEGEDALRAKIMRVQKLKREAWWREELAKVREEVRAVVEAQPAYRAHDALTAKDADLKLNREDLIRRYGEPILKRLPRGYGDGRGAVYTSGDTVGVSVDTAAELLGYESGDALIEALANLRPKAKLIAAEAEARMNDRHGDLLNSIALADEAQAALHNGERGKKLSMELRSLRRLQRIAEPIAKAREREQRETERIGRDVALDAPPIEIFREAAKRTITEKLVRDVRPNDYLIAERKANRKAFEMLASKRYAEAAQHKQQELLNFELYREALRVRDEVQKLHDYAAQFEKPAKRQKLGKAGEQYLEAIDLLLQEVELQTKSLKAIDRNKMQQWLQLAENQDLYVTPEMVSGYFARNWKDLSVEELRALGDALRNLDHVAGRQLKIMAGQRAIDLAEAVDGAVASAESANAMQPQQLSKPQKGTLDAFADWMGDLLNVRTMAGWLDGGKADGWWHRVLINRASEAQVAHYDLVRRIVTPVNEAVEAYMDNRGRNLDDVFQSRLGPITRQQALSIAFNLGNASNRDKMIRGGLPQWQDGTATPWTEQDIDQIVGNLNAADWRFVQSIWTLLDSEMYPAINELEKRVNGVPLKKVEALPFTVTTHDGEEINLKGGYYPMSYDPRFSSAGQKQETGPLAGLVEGNFAYVTTPKGQTKARVEGFAAPALLDFGSVLGRHLSQSILDLTHREFFMDAQKFLKQPKVRQVLQQRLGENFEKEFNNWLKRIANQGANSPTEALTTSARVAEKLRTNTTVLFLGFKVTTVLAQFAGLSNAVEKIGAGAMWKGTQEAFAHPAKSLTFVMEKSGRMRQRWNTLDQSIYEAMGKLHRSKLERARDAINRAAFAGIAIADRLVATPTWIGAYRQALAAGISEENAIHAADEAVISSQGDGASMELSKIQGERGFTRLFTVFYTPFAAQFNRLYSAGRKLKQGGVRYAPEFVMRALLITMIPAIIADLLTGRGPQTCEPEDTECFARWAGVKGLSSLTAVVPFVREGGQLIEAQFEGRFKPDLKYSPVFSAIERAGNAISKMGDALTDGEMSDEVFWKAFESSGLFLGLPTAQPAITGEYLFDLLSGEADGETWYRDLFFRRKGNS